ncbi:MAG: cupin domain-containing protein [candidate division WOR-3 bacterium]
MRSSEGTLEPARIVELAGLVDYAEGAIVSRTLIQRPAGTVTLFSFDRGQALSEHTAPFDALVFVLDGEGEITIDGKPFRVKTGEAILMPANLPHSVSAVDKFKMLLVMVKG